MKRPLAILAIALSSACATSSADKPAAPEPAPAATQTRAGSYTLTASEFIASPEGCRLGEGMQHEAWSFDMADTASGPWSATEHYGDKTNPYTCEATEDGFTCTSEAGHDYSTHGVDADVKLDIRYDGTWAGADSMAGSFELAFTCQGAQCAEVAGHWGVSEFPCSNEGSFEGSR